MKRWIVGLVVVLALALASVVHADVVLWNDEQITIDSFQGNVTLYDTSRAFIVSGGKVDRLDSYDTSNVDISGGNVDRLDSHATSNVDISGGVMNALDANGSSNVDISDGIVGTLNANDSSIVTISDGITVALNANGYSNVEISGGTIVNYLHANSYSNVEISGGTGNRLDVNDSSNVDILGGSMTGLYTYGSSTVDISGGSMTGLFTNDHSTVTLNVKDFRLGAGLTLEGERLSGAGVLSGEWMDGTPRWAINISQITFAAVFISVRLAGDANDDGVVDDKDASILGAHWLQTGNWLDGDFNADNVVNDKDAAILAAHWGEGVGEESVPEPGSLALLAGMALMGVVCLRRRNM
jgi:hypothetical protein